MHYRNNRNLELPYLLLLQIFQHCKYLDFKLIYDDTHLARHLLLQYLIIGK